MLAGEPVGAAARRAVMSGFTRRTYSRPLTNRSPPVGCSFGAYRLACRSPTTPPRVTTPHVAVVSRDRSLAARRVAEARGVRHSLVSTLAGTGEVSTVLDAGAKARLTLLNLSY